MKAFKAVLLALSLSVIVAGCKKSEPERLPGPQADRVGASSALFV
jgi:hypothetical protein